MEFKPYVETKEKTESVLKIELVFDGDKSFYIEAYDQRGVSQTILRVRDSGEVTFPIFHLSGWDFNSLEVKL